MKEGCPHGNQGKDLQRKNHLFDIIDIAHNQGRGTVDAFGEEIENNESGKKNERKLEAALSSRTPASLEDHAENEGVNGQHQHGVEERPEKPKDRSSIAPDHFALGHLNDQVAGLPHPAHHM